MAKATRVGLKPEKLAAKQPRNKPAPTAPPSTGKITKTQKWEAVTLKRSEIRNAPYNNVRMIDDVARRALRDNIARIGHIAPISVNRRTEAKGWKPEECGYYLLSGHQRTAVTDAIEGGTEYALTAAVVELGPKQERAQSLFVNNTSAQGQFDQAPLEKLLLELKSDGVALEETGWSPMDIANLFPDNAELVGMFDASAQDPEVSDDLAQLAEIAQSGKAKPAAAPAPEAEAPSADAAAAEIAKIRAARREHQASDRAETDTEIFLVVVFQKRAHGDALIKAIGGDQNDRYINGSTLLGCLGIDTADIDAEAPAPRGDDAADDGAPPF